MASSKGKKMIELDFTCMLTLTWMIITKEAFIDLLVSTERVVDSRSQGHGLMSANHTFL